MERRIVVLVAVVVVLVASVATAVAVTVTDDGRWSGQGDAMMSSRGYEGDDGDGGPTPSAHGTWAISEHAYLAEMVAHHEEAVAAAAQLQRSQRPAMRDFGAAIMASQSAQIDQMKQWLTDWYPDRSGWIAYQPMMRDLTGLSGDRLDLVFLQDMVWHHMGAVMLSQQLLLRGAADHEQVEALAETIRDEQHVEIFQMQRWLREWFATAYLQRWR